MGTCDLLPPEATALVFDVSPAAEPLPHYLQRMSETTWAVFEGGGGLSEVYIITLLSYFVY